MYLEILIHKKYQILNIVLRIDLNWSIIMMLIKLAQKFSTKLFLHIMRLNMYRQSLTFVDSYLHRIIFLYNAEPEPWSINLEVWKSELNWISVIKNVLYHTILCLFLKNTLSKRGSELGKPQHNFIKNLHIFINCDIFVIFKNRCLKFSRCGPLII